MAQDFGALRKLVPDLETECSWAMLSIHSRICILESSIYITYGTPSQLISLSCKTECMLCYFHFESREIKIEALQ